MRRVYQLQRAAGRCFYAWAIQLSTRLQKMLAVDAGSVEKGPASRKDKRVAKLQDDLEDFLDDATVNGEVGGI